MHSVGSFVPSELTVMIRHTLRTVEGVPNVSSRSSLRRRFVMRYSPW